MAQVVVVAVESMAATEFLALTAVRYGRGDLLGKCLALVSLAPIFLLAQLAALVAVRRDWPTLVLLAGQLLNDRFNALLKSFLRQARPEACELEDFGMPSNHAQFMGFLLCYSALFLHQRCDCPRWEAAAWVAGTAALTALVCVSRIYLAYHTTGQVLVGLGVGLAAGGCWFAAYVARLERLGSALAGSRLGRSLLLKDHSGIRNVLRFEWHCLQAVQTREGVARGEFRQSEPELEEEPAAGCGGSPVHKYRRRTSRKRW